MILRRLIIRVVTMAVAVGIVVIVQHRKESQRQQNEKANMSQVGQHVIDVDLKSTPVPSLPGPPPTSAPLLPTPAPAPASTPAAP